MGLTIHYSLHSRTKSAARSHRLVEQMRQIALDLPFEEVGEIVSLEGDACDAHKQLDKVDDQTRWLLIQSSQYIKSPWNERECRSVSASRIIAFQAYPGPGSEPANIGLCQYPAYLDWEYLPKHDARFEEEFHPGGPSCTSWRFSWKKWKRWLDRRRMDRFVMPDDDRFAQLRQVRTHLSGWRWSSFCKTQYASDPRCGGAANFLRCHISVVTLLDRIAKLPTLAIEMDDEGRYGPSKYSDDWKQARAEGREPTYPWHKGKYDPKALVSEVGDWNQLIASFAGAFKDAARKTGFDCESAIAKFPNFESLEFRGSQDKRVGPFLAALKGLVDQTRPNDDSATGT